MTDTSSASAAPKAIAAWAPSKPLLDALVGALDGAGKKVIRVASPESLAKGEGVALAVLFAPDAIRDGASAWPYFQALGDNRPLVVIGSEPPPSVAGVTMWLPTLPPPALLRSIVDQLLVEGGSGKWRAVPAVDPPPDANAPAKPAWRRKTDMILGESAATTQLLRDLDRLAPMNGIVLVTGDSGTGKELVAQTLHFSGPRARQPFIAINCAAIPENLVEAELFGSARGAFTGAVTARAGAFESAQGGTLFLDEIGEMPKAIQPKLLRILETHTFSRVGETETRKVNARLVVATNRDLAVEVKEGRFREDLYYRLNVYPIQLLPLRRRPEDLPAIIGHHLRQIAAREARPTPRLSPAAFERLVAFDWPGNVRQLLHVLTRAMFVATKDVIEEEHIQLPAAGENVALARYRDAKLEFERDYYSRLVRVANGNITLAARLAGKTRKEVYDALKRIGLDASAYRLSANSDDES